MNIIQLLHVLVFLQFQQDFRIPRLMHQRRQKWRQKSPHHATSLLVHVAAWEGPGNTPRLTVCQYVLSVLYVCNCQISNRQMFGVSKGALYVHILYHVRILGTIFIFTFLWNDVWMYVYSGPYPCKQKLQFIITDGVINDRSIGSRPSTINLVIVIIVTKHSTV